MSAESQLKGIAIRVHEEVLEKIEAQQLPRSELVEKALLQFFDKNTKPTKKVWDSEDIPDDVYGDIYNEIYNLEVLPLKQRIQHQQEVTMLMQERIMDLEQDKKFLQNQAEHLACFANAHKPFSIRRNKEVKHPESDSSFIVEEEI